MKLQDMTLQEWTDKLRSALTGAINVFTEMNDNPEELFDRGITAEENQLDIDLLTGLRAMYGPSHREHEYAKTQQENKALKARIADLEAALEEFGLNED